MIFHPLPPQLGQTVSVGMMHYYRAVGGAGAFRLDSGLLNRVVGRASTPASGSPDPLLAPFASEKRVLEDPRRPGGPPHCDLPQFGQAPGGEVDSAGINRREVVNARVMRERSS